MQTPWLTIFTPTKNRPYQLLELAACLLGQTQPTGWQWVVWHDGPDANNYLTAIAQLPKELNFSFSISSEGDQAMPQYRHHREYPMRQVFTRDYLNTPWIVYVDDDDLLVNDFVETLQPHALTADLIQWKMVMIKWMKSATTESWLVPGKLQSGQFEDTGLLILDETGRGIGSVGMGSFAVKSELSREINFPIWNGTGDQAHYIGCQAIADRLVRLPKALYVYR